MNSYLAEGLKTLSKDRNDDHQDYPSCPDCGQAMVVSFALPYKEWVCAPCGTGLPMFNGQPKVRRSIKYMKSKKRSWSKDLSVIARRIGGARCAECEDGSCEYCERAADKDYKFVYWEKNLEENNHV